MQYFIIGFCIKDTSLTFLSIYISNYISGRLNPLQQELQINSRSPYFAVPSLIHQVSPTTWSAVSRRRQRLKRSGQAGCASGGRSGREGGRSAGNSGDLPHRSVPSYSPHSDNNQHDSLCPWILLEWFHQTPLRAGLAGYRQHI